MKYLKKNNLSEALQLIDLIELQIEISENSYKSESLIQFIEIHKIFHSHVIEFFKLIKINKRRYKLLLDNTREEYNNLYIEDKGINENEVIVRINPLIRRISKYYLSILNKSFQEEEEESFNFYYNTYLNLLKIISNFKINNEIKIVKFFEEVEVDQALTKSEFIELQYLYDRNLQNLSKNSSEFSKIQSYFYTDLIWRLKKDLILEDNFHLNLIEEAVKSFVFGLTEIEINPTIIKNISEELFLIMDRITYFEYYFNSNYEEDYSKTFQLAKNIISQIDFDNFSKHDLYTSLSPKVKEDFSHFSKYLLKIGILKEAWIKILSNYLYKGHIDFVITILFGRQPLNSNYTSGNLDFFPIESVQIIGFLINYHNSRWAAIDYGYRDNNLQKEKNEVLVLILFRNYYWSKIHGYRSEPAFVCKDDYENIKLKRILEYISQYQQIVYQTNINCKEEFLGWLAKEVNRLTVEIEKRVVEAEIDSQIKIQFEENVFKASFPENSFLKLIGKEVKHFDNYDWLDFNNTELHDKKPFINQDLVEIPNINAIEVFAKVTVQNLLFKIDHFLYNQLRLMSDFSFLSLFELENKLLNESENGEILNCNVHFGWEIMKNNFNYDTNVCKTKNGNEITVKNMQNYSNNKYIILFKKEIPKNFIDYQKPILNFEINNDNKMEVKAKLSVKLRVNKLALAGIVSEIIIIK
jgi:hypothetical protein